MERWYIGRSKAQKEGALQSFLGHHGVEVYLPRIVRPGTGAWEPLFPGYLFCRFDPQGALAPLIRWAPGLAYLLGAEGRPLPVPDALVAEVRERVARWNGGGYQGRFAPGAPVRVAQGPLAGLEGIFQGYVPARQRCRVLLRVVGRLAAVELPEAHLAPQGAVLRGARGALA